MSREVAEREGDTRSELGSALTAKSPTWGSNSQAMRSQPEQKLDAQLTVPPRCSLSYHFISTWFFTVLNT